MQLTRVPKKLPVVLSPQEVEKLIAAAPNVRYRMILLLLYATGLRRAEASRLKIADIDSQRMVIHVHEGKNSRDRELPLTPKLLEALRAYWRACKVKPKVYLFPTRFKTTDEERPVTDKAVWHACVESARRAGLSKRLGPHTLRNASAYCTTFQSPFILKTIDLGQARFAEVYGRRAGPPSLATAPPLRTSPFSRLSMVRT